MRHIQMAAFDLFEHRGYDQTTVDDVAAATDVSPRTVFRYFPAKEDLVFWSTYSPRLPALMAEQPTGIPAVLALRRALAAGLAATFGDDQERILRWARIGFGTSSLHPRMRVQQAALADLFTTLLLDRVPNGAPELAVRVAGAALAAALFVALDLWQSGDGSTGLQQLIDQALADACGTFDF